MPRRNKTLVGNAADRAQITLAERVEAKRDERLLACLQVLLAQAEGRLVLWELLADTGMFRSIWDPSAKIHYNAGRQDFGHYLYDLYTQAAPDLYVVMEQEARARLERERAGVTASRTPRADESTTEEGEDQ
jgi:hypothetical protein